MKNHYSDTDKAIFFASIILGVVFIILIIWALDFRIYGVIVTTLILLLWGRGFIASLFNLYGRPIGWNDGESENDIEEEFDKELVEDPSVVRHDYKTNDRPAPQAKEPVHLESVFDRNYLSKYWELLTDLIKKTPWRFVIPALLYLIFEKPPFEFVILATLIVVVVGIKNQSFTSRKKIIEHEKSVEIEQEETQIKTQSYNNDAMDEETTEFEPNETTEMEDGNLSTDEDEEYEEEFIDETENNSKELSDFEKAIIAIPAFIIPFVIAVFMAASSNSPVWIFIVIAAVTFLVYKNNVAKKQEKTSGSEEKSNNATTSEDDEDEYLPEAHRDTTLYEESEVNIKAYKGEFGWKSESKSQDIIPIYSYEESDNPLKRLLSSTATIIVFSAAWVVVVFGSFEIFPDIRLLILDHISIWKLIGIPISSLVGLSGLTGIAFNQPEYSFEITEEEKKARLLNFIKIIVSLGGCAFLIFANL